MINGLSAGAPVDYEALSEKVIKYRRDLHQIPELGFLVYKTGAYVKEKLSAFDCELSDIVTTGILAFFDFGCESTIIFRADMDALPIEEATGLPYASKNPGCMHACGHDGHMAGLIGFAEILDRYKKEGYKAKYNALLLFQPAEETIDGALRICGTHIFDRYNVKAIFGLHLWPMMAKGEIASRPGPMMARSTAVNVTFEGVSAHCGEPQKGRDALAAACRFVSDIYSYKEHHVRERSVLKFGRMESGNVRNAISPFARLEGTMRTFYDNTWEHLVFAMKKLASEIEEAFGVKAFNSYGLSEMCGPGLAFECPFRNGMHLWEDHYYMEIIDPDTCEVLPDGEEGELVLTSLRRKAMPLIRYRTHDLTRILPEPCPCGRTHRRIARMKGRSDDMLIINGVNIFPQQIEKAILTVPEIGAHYIIEITKESLLDRIHVKVEVNPNYFTGSLEAMDAIRKKVIDALKTELGVNPRVELVAPNSLPADEGKAKRVFDLRDKDYAK